MDKDKEVFTNCTQDVYHRSPRDEYTEVEGCATYT